MCGIAGIISKQQDLKESDKATVRKMVSRLDHRGPDEEGHYTDEYCALGMRRLSIIDLKGGTQPIYNEARDILVLQNGEIYNYLELRKDLSAQGHVFSTQSDTEVLVHLYEEYGLNLFRYVNGMFAFCLYDIRKKRFLLARDAFGEKPLYYSDIDNSICFSSEISSLLANHGIPRKLNQVALNYYLRTSLVPSPITLFQDINQLPAGHFMIVENDRVEVKQYFKIDYKPDPGIKSISDAVELVRPKLENALHRQAISDVPLGYFLSGGIDSSTVVGLSQQESKRPIMTFNVRFEDENYDESKIARKVADYYGTHHHEIVVENQRFEEELFWQIIDHFGQPFRDTSAIPMFQISKEMRRHVKVAISGDGGDEMFGGYTLFHWYQMILKLKKVPLALRKAFQVLIQGLENSNFSNHPKLRQINRAILTSNLAVDEIAIALNEMFPVSEMIELFPRADSSLPLLKSNTERRGNWTNLREIMHYRTIHTLSNNMLTKVDAMSMANSLEVRAPFLDRDLANTASLLPDKYLMRKGIGKIVMRDMMKNDLPKEVFDHPKQGFNIPLHKYQNSNYQKLAKNLLFEENPMLELFNRKALEDIYQRGVNRDSKNSRSVFRMSHQLWMVMQLFGWAKRFKVSID